MAFMILIESAEHANVGPPPPKPYNVRSKRYAIDWAGRFIDCPRSTGAGGQARPKCAG